MRFNHLLHVRARMRLFGEAQATAEACVCEEEKAAAEASDTCCFSHACPVGVWGVGHISACRGGRRDMR